MLFRNYGMVILLPYNIKGVSVGLGALELCQALVYTDSDYVLV